MYHLSRLMVSHQNLTTKNRFCLANYAADLDEILFNEDKAEGDEAPEVPIPVRISYIIHGELEQLTELYDEIVRAAAASRPASATTAAAS